ncbi:hypothetical protein AcV5_003071 [Taiwanofungus camphoratus]|nr:hypothetical protein AcV5_003071 [Antrodia cinnamomea]KAI0954346.1 hypothetical protein AcV7_007608 [Antrodia cinnamomea]KAI0954347.1 hypothetical protein AcV7_007608 [Antrodia cinnamomea]
MTPFNDVQNILKLIDMELMKRYPDAKKIIESGTIDPRILMRESGLIPVCSVDDPVVPPSSGPLTRSQEPENGSFPNHDGLQIVSQSGPSSESEQLNLPEFGTIDVQSRRVRRRRRAKDRRRALSATPSPSSDASLTKKSNGQNEHRSDLDPSIAPDGSSSSAVKLEDIKVHPPVNERASMKRRSPTSEPDHQPSKKQRRRKAGAPVRGGACPGTTSGMCHWHGCHEEMDPASIYGHIRKAHGFSEEDKLECLWDGCPAGIIRKDDMPRHIQDVHLRLRDVPCPRCGQFCRHDMLGRHKRCCRLKCRTCRRKFSSEAAVDAHELKCAPDCDH